MLKVSSTGHRFTTLLHQFRPHIVFAAVAATGLGVLPGFSQSADMLARSNVAVTSAVPPLIKYSGTLLDSRGYAITVPVEVTFSLYGQETDGETALWQEHQHISPNERGAYTTYLGAGSAHGVPAELFTTVAAQWLGVKVESEAELPRVFLASIPYALKAEDAHTLGGLPASAFALAGSVAAGATSSSEPLAQPVVAASASTVTTTGGVSGYLPKFTGASTVADSLVYDTGTTIGIGVGSTPNTSVKLDIGGGMIVRGNTIVSRSGNATTSTGYPSWGFQFFSNAYNSSSKANVNPYFVMRSEPTGNNTASPSATFNMLFSNNGATPAETGFYINPNGTLHFASGQVFPGAVTSVGLSAPSSDFAVSGSPVTGSGTLGFNWIVPPTSGNIASSIVKRDSSGGFSGGAVSATSMTVSGTAAAQSVLSNSLFVTNNSTLYGSVGIGENIGTPQALLQLNNNNNESSDTLLIGNNSSKGLQLRDTGTGVDLESIGVPLYVNYTTQEPLYLNYNGGAVYVGDGCQSSNDCNDFSPSALYVGSVDDQVGDYTSAVFRNDVIINGNLAVNGTKNFRIDHPMDPANKYLVHAAIESSEVLNQYSGNIITDESGVATVHLPDWFEVENIDFRYQLTVVGETFAQAIVSRKVANNEFTIKTNAPRVEVSWQVTAKRNDPYMRAHPMVVEPEKSARQRGHYDHPELYGHPEEAHVHPTEAGHR